MFDTVCLRIPFVCFQSSTLTQKLYTEKSSPGLHYVCPSPSPSESDSINCLFERQTGKNNRMILLELKVVDVTVIYKTERGLILKQLFS